MDLSKLTDRSQLGQFLNENGLVGTGVEVGSKSGGFAAEIMKDWSGRLLFMIDPWEPQDPSVYRERQDWTNFEDCFKECLKLDYKYTPRVSLLKAYSPAIASKFRDGELDFCYIDGNHSYEAAMADMNAWYPKVKMGGLFCGHDCYNDTAWPSHCEVQKALEEWMSDKGVNYHRTNCTSWWIQKL